MLLILNYHNSLTYFHLTFKNQSNLGFLRILYVGDFITLALIPLIFFIGETKRTAILTILDDSEPEDNESILVSLVHTEGGSRILPTADTVRVDIVANDNVAGIVGFQTGSRSVIGHEGGFLFLLGTVVLFSVDVIFVM